MLSQSRIIAKGRRIRDVKRLVATYGGKSSEWVKKSSPVFESGGLFYEHHWYENPGTGRVEIKKKEVLMP
ncbi:MAG: hypothetical protein B6245_22695 [Desulfobacteraceae bacterium 4572_88]|nr:MAG: hypothetical protein B6245_22695 [Desulfobacteraceae bacterium 4572_88]